MARESTALRQAWHFAKSINQTHVEWTEKISDGYVCEMLKSMGARMSAK